MSAVFLHPTSKDEDPIQHSPLPPDASETRVAKWGIGFAQPGSIVGGIVLTGLVAILHHVFDDFLAGKSLNGFWTQLMSHRTENAFAAVFHLLFAYSLGVILCQVVSENTQIAIPH